ncbi:MAG: energy transducer TonB [Flavobacteriales bacterium]|nr:energy transducer TonB [Flavobacteriales bacterium]
MIPIAVLFAALLLFSIALSSTGWSNVLSAARNELVFADRNKAYGAYVIRQEHHRTMLIAFFTSVGLMGALLFLPRLFQDPVVNADPPSLTATDCIFDILPPSVLPKTDIPKVNTKKPEQSKPAPTQDASVRVAVDSVLTTPLDTTTTTVSTDLIGDSTSTNGPDTGNSTNSSGGTTGSNETGPIDDWGVDVKPGYPGGEKELYKYLKRSIKYPVDASRLNKSGRVVIAFVVDADGTITSATVVKGVHPSIDAEALRVVREMIKWNPGKYQGKNVAVRFKLPIVFTVM